MPSTRLCPPCPLRSAKARCSRHASLGGLCTIALHPSRASKPVLDEHLYRERHHIEYLFARLKANRRIATRYEKSHDTFAAMVCLACLRVWLKY